MKYKMRKAYQRKLNKRIRALNKNIENDDLWRGRFVFLQMRTDWYEFEDKSGGELRVIIRAYDRRTGYYKDYIMDYAPWLHSFDWHLSVDVANAFITNDALVWQADPRPSLENVIDYRQIPLDREKVKAGPFNWYITEQFFEENGYVRV